MDGGSIYILSHTKAKEFMGKIWLKVKVNGHSCQVNMLLLLHAVGNLGPEGGFGD